MKKTQNKKEQAKQAVLQDMKKDHIYPRIIFVVLVLIVCLFFIFKINPDVTPENVFKFAIEIYFLSNIFYYLVEIYKSIKK